MEQAERIGSAASWSGGEPGRCVSDGGRGHFAGIQPLHPLDVLASVTARSASSYHGMSASSRARATSSARLWVSSLL